MEITVSWLCPKFKNSCLIYTTDGKKANVLGKVLKQGWFDLHFYLLYAQFRNTIIYKK